MATATENPADFKITDEQRPLTEIPVNPPNATDDADDSTSTGKEQLTVFHSADNFNVKHPLMNKWTLWYTKPPSGKGENWNDMLKKVVTFDSVEEFWGIYVSAPCWFVGA